MVKKWPFLKLKFSGFFLPKLKNTLVKKIFVQLAKKWPEMVVKWPNAIVVGFFSGQTLLSLIKLSFCHSLITQQPMGPKAFSVKQAIRPLWDLSVSANSSLMIEVRKGAGKPEKFFFAHPTFISIFFRGFTKRGRQYWGTMSG